MTLNQSTETVSDKAPGEIAKELFHRKLRLKH